jgi:hypothetical protein
MKASCGMATNQVGFAGIVLIARSGMLGCRHEPQGATADENHWHLHLSSAAGISQNFCLSSVSFLVIGLAPRLGWHP